jgi:hypothetical protein
MKSYLAIGGTGPTIGIVADGRFASPLVLALILAMPNARAEDGTKQDVNRGGEHPAVNVARRGVQVDPTSKFYPHPAWLYCSPQRPTDEREEPTLPVAGGGRDSAKNPGPCVAVDSRSGAASRETR